MLLIRLAGPWTLPTGAPVVTEVFQQLNTSPPVRRLIAPTQELTGLDSRLLTGIRQVLEVSMHQQVAVVTRLLRRPGVGCPGATRPAAAVTDAPRLALAKGMPWRRRTFR
jgi:hypothetical protein